jgi:hypothetical protein
LTCAVKAPGAMCWRSRAFQGTQMAGLVAAKPAVVAGQVVEQAELMEARAAPLGLMRDQMEMHR